MQRISKNRKELIADINFIRDRCFAWMSENAAIAVSQTGYRSNIAITAGYNF